MQCTVRFAAPLHNGKLLKSSRGSVHVSRVKSSAPQKVGAASGGRELVSDSPQVFLPIVAGIAAGGYVSVFSHTEDTQLSVSVSVLVAVLATAFQYFIQPRPSEVSIRLVTENEGVELEAIVGTKTRSYLRALSGGSLPKLTNALATKWNADPKSVKYIGKSAVGWSPSNDLEVEELLRDLEIIRMTSLPGVPKE